MKIFRLENPSGYGPWQHTDIPYLYVGDCYDLDCHHPGAREDGLVNYTMKAWNFGCDSIKQLQEWFCASVVNNITGVYPDFIAAQYESDDFKTLATGGYVVKVYEISDEDNDCCYGNSLRQIVFKKSKAKLIDTVSLKELFIIH